MKNLISIIALLLFVLTGCSKDETSEDSNSSNFLVGKWEITAYIDEYDYAWTDEEGFYVFSNERVHVQFGGDTYDESEATEYVYEYLPGSNELILGPYVMDVEIKNNNNVILRNGCCGDEIIRIE